MPLPVGQEPDYTAGLLNVNGVEVRVYKPAVVSTPAVANPAGGYVSLAPSFPGVLPAGTYYVAYSWTNASGETLTSTPQSINMAGGSNINASPPAFPAGVTGINYYISTAVGSTTLGYAGHGTTAATFAYNALGSNTQHPSSSNTTGGPGVLVWQRVKAPMPQLKEVSWETLERGGYGTGVALFQAIWSDLVLTGDESVDVWVDGTLRYRGYVLMPEGTLQLEEVKTLNLFGPAGRAGTWRVTRRYAYGSDDGTGVDLSVIAIDLINDYLNAAGRLPGVAVYTETIGINQPAFDAVGATIQEALNRLVDVAPNTCVWGFDVDPFDTSQRPNDRIYFRSRSSTVKYKLPVGRRVTQIDHPKGIAEIVNSSRILGGKVDLPNLVKNGSFEFPVPGGPENDNMLNDGSFEQSFEASSAFWHLGSGASIKDYSDPGNGTPLARTGSRWLNLDSSGELAYQDIAIDPHTHILAKVWVRRGNISSPATFTVQVEGLDSTGAVITTSTYMGVPGMIGYGVTTSWDPFEVFTEDGNVDVNRYVPVELLVDFTSFGGGTNVRAARLLMVSHGGSGNSNGVVFDDASISYVRTVQQSWRGLASNHTAVAPAFDWIHKETSVGDSTPPLHGGYCLKVSYAPPAGHYAELRTDGAAQMRFDPNFTYYVIAWVRAPAGQNYNLSVGATFYDNNGAFVRDVQSGAFLGNGDGLWHSLFPWFTLNSGSSQTQVELFIRIRNNVTTYIDCVGVYAGIPPSDFWFDGSGVPPAYVEDDQFQYHVAVGDLPVHDPPGLGQVSTEASQSVANYGVFEQDLSDPNITSILQARIAAAASFNAKAVPKYQTRVSIENELKVIDYDGQVLLVNLEQPPPAMFPARAAYRITASNLTTTLELGNERPVVGLQKLLQQQAGQALGVVRQAIPPIHRGVTPTGDPGVDVMHLSGVETATGQKTFAAGAQASDYFSADGSRGVNLAPQFFVAGSSGGSPNVQVNPVMKNGLMVGWTQTVSTPPAVPAGVTATAGDTEVVINWNVAAGADNYTVLRSTVNGGPYTQVGTTVNQFYHDLNVVNGTAYYYVVQANNGAGASANSAQVTATPGANAPTAPTGLKAVPGNTIVELSWTAALGATSYTVQQATVTGGPYTTVASGITSLSYQVTGLTNGTPYFFVAIAVNSNGSSALSNEATATPALNPFLGTANLVLLLDPDTYGLLDAQAIATHVDSSGSGNDLSSPGSNQALLSANQLHGHSIARFDANNNDYASRAGSLAANDLTLIVVMRTPVPRFGFVFQDGGGAGHDNHTLQVGAGYQPVSFGVNSVGMDTGFTAPTGQWGIYTVFYNATSGNMSAWKGQSAGGTSNVAHGGSLAAAQTVLGSDVSHVYSSSIDIAYLGLFSRELTAGERQPLWTFLAGRFNLTL